MNRRPPHGGKPPKPRKLMKRELKQRSPAIDDIDVMFTRIWKARAGRKRAK